MIKRIHKDLAGEAGAIFSSCERYRYQLWREWDASKPALTFIMLNPSTATELMLDPTIDRCRTRAVAGGFGRLNVVNLFALRSTDPKLLYEVDDPIGPDNDAVILECTRAAGTIICGWGKHGKLKNRDTDVLILLNGSRTITHALKLNKNGTPAHPLYLSYKLQPITM